MGIPLDIIDNVMLLRRRFSSYSGLYPFYLIFYRSLMFWKIRFIRVPWVNVFFSECDQGLERYWTSFDNLNRNEWRTKKKFFFWEKGNNARGKNSVTYTQTPFQNIAAWINVTIHPIHPRAFEACLFLLGRLVYYYKYIWTDRLISLRRQDGNGLSRIPASIPLLKRRLLPLQVCIFSSLKNQYNHFLNFVRLSIAYYFLYLMSIIG